MRASEPHFDRGAVIIAVVAGAFALTGSAGGNISPVADQIAYMSTLDGEADIYTMAPTGLLNFNLTHDKTTRHARGCRAGLVARRAVRRFPAELPEGRHADAPSSILVAADGTKLGPLTPPMKGVVDMHPTWAPDGQSIVFSSDRDGNFELYLYTDQQRPA